VLLTLCYCTSLNAQPTACFKQGKARVVIVGDSITGQSRNVASGYANQMEAAIRAVYPGCEPQIISLGGSGQSVGSWQNVERKSQTKETFLDIKGIDVQQTLAQRADVLIIMLGMNDVLAPYVADNTQSIDKWQTRYEQLIEALQQRVHPGVLALAGVTPCTEEPTSPKNKMVDLLNERVRLLAEKYHARYLTTSQTVWTIFKDGRQKDHAFHVTADYVHPTTAGHIGIAMAMLQGLGENQAVKWLNDERLEPLMQKISEKKQPFSWEIQAVFNPEKPDIAQYDIQFWFLNPNAIANVEPYVAIKLPQNWHSSMNAMNAMTGIFSIKGKPDQLLNTVTLTATMDKVEYKADIQLPTPWLVGLKMNQRYWNRYDFDAEKARTPVDEVIEQNGDFTAPIDLGKGQTLTWAPYYPSVNFTGGDDPSSVDFSALTHADNFEGGYAARWVHSDKDRTCIFEPKNRMFAGVFYLTAWVNAKQVYAAKPKRGDNVEIQLKQGWNTLVYKINHHNWQWQVNLPITGKDGDDLSDLRYSITPQH
jgi:lysophospholipase L1-like esterase